MTQEKLVGFIDQEISSLNLNEHIIKYEVSPNHKKLKGTEKDSYVLSSSVEGYLIEGKNLRSVLFGVYDLSNKLISNSSILIDSVSEVARFHRRGNILEVINDIPYVKSLIDQAGKNKLNEFFFTFKLWDEISKDVIEDLEKRGMNVCLGGHSLNFLLNDIISEESKNAFNLSFFENDFLMQKSIQKIVKTCAQYDLINRLSIWPADFGINAKKGYEFMSQYIEYIDRLKLALETNNLTVEVEHIVYNAGLSWEMLERDERIEGSTKSNILYAYWGRDYSNSINAEETHQSRAKEILKDWKTISDKNKTNLTVLEYYSDFYMMSELFPPLANRIEDDLNQFEAMELYGVLNLIVPLLNSKNYEDIKNTYPWQWIHLYNNYIYSNLAWGDDLETLKNKWFRNFTKTNEWIIFMDKLEAKLSQVSRFNRVLFNKRVVDIYEYEEDNYEHVLIILKETIDLINENEVLFKVKGDDVEAESLENKTINYIKMIKGLIEKTLTKMKISE